VHKHAKKKEKEKENAAREQGSGPPEERVGKDTGEKKILSSSSWRRRRLRRETQARAFSLSFSSPF